MSLFSSKKEGIQVTNLNKEYFKQSASIAGIFSKKQEKNYLNGSASSNSNTVFYIEFKGDVFASAVKSLGKEINAILIHHKAGDEVVISIESPGGTVTGYGLVAEQLERLRSAGIKITAVVDQVAASGGYMMACVADKIIVAKRAVLGSLGVVVGVPNLEKLLDTVGINYKFYTAGEKKRGVTQFSTPTDEQVEDLENELKTIHEQFKEHVSFFRPHVDIEKLATGETWSGYDSVQNGLADEIGISDDVIYKMIASKKLVLHIKHYVPVKRKSMFSRASAQITSAVIETISDKILNSIQTKATKKW